MDTEHILTPDDRILVTGSNGFIGSRVVQTLLDYGFRNLRCLVRPSSDLTRLNRVLEPARATGNVELVTGDLISREDCERAAEGVAAVLHLAAGMDKSFAGAFMNSALGTRNLLDALLERGNLRRFVNVSSFAVYSNLSLERGALLDENCALETAPQERGDAYCFGKLKQEEIVRRYGRERGLPYVILRPGAVFGPGKKAVTGRVGIDTFGFFIHLGGTNQIPFTYVDNCAEAIVLAALKAGIEGEAFNVVDDGLVTSSEFLRAYKQRTGGFFSLRIPYRIAAGVCDLWERYSTYSQGQLPPVFNRRRCAAEWKGNRFSNEKLRQRVGWTPRVKMGDALAAYLSQFENAAA
ncbi:MAG TPA: NAD(P)-dependent oxidoreductase [Chthoniobacterales bacterium]